MFSSSCWGQFSQIDRHKKSRQVSSLIDQVVLVPAGKALEIEIKGELAGILELCAGARKEKPGTVSSAGLAEQLKMVAGARNQRWLRLSEAWL